jgi:hypothetical protein
MEQEVSKLKASIGLMLDIISVMLQIESLDRNELAQCEVKQAVDHTKEAFANSERLWLFRLDETATATQLDAIARHVDCQVQQILQRLPLLATQDQLSSLEDFAQKISNKVDAIALSAYPHQSQPPLQRSPDVQMTHCKTSVMHAELRQKGIKIVGEKIDELFSQTKALHTVFSGNQDSRTVPTPGSSEDRDATTTYPAPQARPTGREPVKSSNTTAAHVRQLFANLVAALLLFIRFIPMIKCHLLTLVTVANIPRLWKVTA